MVIVKLNLKSEIKMALIKGLKMIRSCKQNTRTKIIVITNYENLTVNSSN